MGRPLKPRGGRDPGGGGTGLPEALRGGRAARLPPGAVGAAGAADAAAEGEASAGAAPWAAADAGAEAAAAAGAGVAGAAAGAGAGAEGGRAAAGVGADCAAGADGAAGDAGGATGAGRLLLIRRGDRTGGSDAAGASTPPAAAPAPVPAAGADTGRAGAFLTGAPLAAELLETDVNGLRAGASPPLASPSPEGSADLVAWAALVAFAAFFAGAGSSGWTGRRRPSASALRRTRSAWASSMEDEWLLTPIPRDKASSSPSLLVRPSSLASS
jgi:hypothetical protein